MKLYEALDILDEEGLILERKSVKDMTPEEYKADLEKRRERRKKRLERNASDRGKEEPKVEKTGDWYLMANMSPMPEKIRKGAQMTSCRGTQDIEKLKDGWSFMIGPFSNKELAASKGKRISRNIVEFLEEKMKKVDFTDEDSRYQFKEYTLDKLRYKFFVVDLSEKNKRWSSGRLSPFDSGYWYDSDEEATNAVRKPVEKFVDEFGDKCEEGRRIQREREERRSNYRSSWDPNAGNFRNVFCHH